MKCSLKNVGLHYKTATMLTTNTIKFIKSLQQKKFRKESGLFVAEGHRLVSDLIHSSITIDAVYHTQEWEDAGDINSNYHLVSAKEMARISGLTTPSSVLGLFKIPSNEVSLERLSEELTLVLDDIQDPGNLGTIIRLADWFGIKSVICSHGTADAFSPKVIQATMGAIARINLSYFDIVDLTSRAKNQGMDVFGTFLDGDNIYTSKLQLKGLVVMGNEGNGISPEVAKHITKRITIPSFVAKGVTSESLNVAMATAIVCSEFKRRTIH